MSENKENFLTQFLNEKLIPFSMKVLLLTHQNVAFLL